VGPLPRRAAQYFIRARSDVKIGGECDGGVLASQTLVPTRKLQLVRLPIVADFGDRPVRAVWIVKEVGHGLPDFFFSELRKFLGKIARRLSGIVSPDQLIKRHMGFSHTQDAFSIQTKMG
jgi:hypothetical protein